MPRLMLRKDRDKVHMFSRQKEIIKSRARIPLAIAMPLFLRRMPVTMMPRRMAINIPIYLKPCVPL